MKVKKTREKILDTSIKLFNEKKASNVSTVQISAEMKISPGNLYYYYANKEEIVKCIWNERMLEDIKLLLAGYEAAETAGAFMETLRKSFEHCMRYSFFYTETPTLFANDGSLKDICSETGKLAEEVMIRLYGSWVSEGKAAEESSDAVQAIVRNGMSIFRDIASGCDLSKETSVRQALLDMVFYLKAYLTDEMRREMDEATAAI